MSLCELNIDCLECSSRGMCNSYAMFKYEQGKVFGYSQAEKDYLNKTEEDKLKSFNCGYELGSIEILNKLLVIVSNNYEKEIKVEDLIKDINNLKDKRET